MWPYGNDSSSTNQTQACPHCGSYHGKRCPAVKAIEYYENGQVKRVEFVTAGDVYSPAVVGSELKPPYDITIGSTTIYPANTQWAYTPGGGSGTIIMDYK